MKLSFYPIKLYFTRRQVVIPIVGSLVVNMAIWIWLLTQFPPTDETVFLHYNVLFGVDLVGSWSQLLWLPISGLLLLILNTILGWISYQYDTFISTVLLTVTMCMQVVLFFSMYMLVFLNV